MTQNRLLTASFLGVLLLVAHLASAQRVQKKEHEEQGKTSFQSKLWYGGGVQLGFSSYYGSNLFAFGISPMVGYKIIKPLSIGPRVEVIYTSYKQAGFKAVSLFDIDAGVFLRFKVFRGLFLQGELSNEWRQDPVYLSEDKIRRQRFNQRVGIGWNFGSGEGGGSELGVFYNFAVANEIDGYENPLGYRFGFTWNY